VSFDAQDLQASGRALLADAVELRREIHAHPELGLDLPRTQQTILDHLADLELDTHTGEATTSVVADLVGDPDGPTVLLRADMDALPMPEDTDLPFASGVPGTMHACGHDAHTAMLVGAARLLADRRDQLRGTVRFMFQPGEEGHHGARFMLDEGVAAGVDRAFAIHATPNLPSGWVGTRGGPLLASADEFRIVVRGRGGHASTPHFANDPIPVACEIVSALQTFVTRRLDVFQPGVISVTRIHAGTANNVIAESAQLEGTVRAVAKRTRSAIIDALERVPTGVASAHEMTAEVEVFEGYPVTVNDPGRAAGTLATATRLLGAERVVEMPTPIMGAEDFSYVLQRVPGAMAFLGMCPEGADPRTVAPNHSNRMQIDESAMADGIALYVAAALDGLVELVT
jgi:amidohydrolase